MALRSGFPVPTSTGGVEGSRTSASADGVGLRAIGVGLLGVSTSLELRLGLSDEEVMASNELSERTIGREISTTGGGADGDATGIGGPRTFPVPDAPSLAAGTGVMMTSTVDVVVLVGSTSLFWTARSNDDEVDEESGPPNRFEMNEVKSMRDSMCSDWLLDDELEYE